MVSANATTNIPNQLFMTLGNKRRSAIHRIPVAPAAIFRRIAGSTERLGFGARCEALSAARNAESCPDFIDSLFVEPAVQTSQAARSAMMSEVYQQSQLCRGLYIEL